MRIILGHPLSLKEIADATGGRLKSSKNIIINAITTDSREVHPFDLFIALNGANFNGEDFLDSVYKSGGFSLSKSPFTKGIIHPSPSDALLRLAEYYIKTLPIILYNIGITGSVGKSTTKEFAKILLSGRYKVHASEGNFNNEIGMPMSILSAPLDTEILLMEMGMNHSGEIAKLSHYLHPNIALITNVGTAHIGNLGSREAIAKAKLEITHGMVDGTLIIPSDEPLLNVKSATTFSTGNPNADYYLRAGEGRKIQIYKRGKLYCEAEFGPMGEHNKKCLVSAAAIAINAEVGAEDVSKQVSLISDNNLRQNVFFAENRLFYTDYYNASLESILALIKWANELVPDNKKSLVLGDILELGEMKDAICFEVGSLILQKDFSNLFLFGEMSEIIASAAISRGFPKEHIFINTDLSSPAVTADQIRMHSPRHNPIFMKASRAVKLERVLQLFTSNK